MHKLQILVCTTADRLPRIDFSLWPRVEGAAYLISCQNPSGKNLKEPQRDDLEYIEFDNRGLSVNRNQAIAAATAPYILIADDDTEFIADGLRAIMDAYDADPTLDYATFRAQLPGNRVYPPDGYDFGKTFRFYFPLSCEITFRRKSLNDNLLRFSELAGLGAPYLCAGEEELLLWHCRKKGLKGRFYDRLILIHPDESTSVTRSADPAFLRTKGVLLRVKRGYLGGLLRIPVEAHRAKVPFFRAAAWLLQGYVYSIRNGRKL